MFDQAANSIPQVQAGKIKAFAVTAKQRLPALPDIPTVDEAGLPGLYIAVWHGLWAPKGTPKDVTARLAAATWRRWPIAQVARSSPNSARTFPTPAQQTPEGAARHHKAEIEQWWPLIKAANIKVD